MKRLAADFGAPLTSLLASRPHTLDELKAHIRAGRHRGSGGSNGDSNTTTTTTTTTTCGLLGEPEGTAQGKRGEDGEGGEDGVLARLLPLVLAEVPGVGWTGGVSLREPPARHVRLGGPAAESGPADGSAGWAVYWVGRDAMASFAGSEGGWG